MIVPETVSYYFFFLPDVGDDTQKKTFIFEGKTPLKLDANVGFDFEERDDIYIPKGCEKKYRQKWKQYGLQKLKLIEWEK